MRAAATSIRRAGFRPIAVDLFADLDLAASAETYRVDPADYPGGIAARVAHLDPVPWMYTGALENHPDLVAEISRRFPPCGVDPDALRAVRDPDQLARVAQRAGFPMPETRRDPAGLPTDGSWLVKPIASGGGLGIGPWLGQDLPGQASTFVWQRWLKGVDYSAIFLGDESRTQLIGVTRQIIGEYRYLGSSGARIIPQPRQAALEALGHALVAEFGLCGLFGVDFMVARAGDWLIEVNPRYSASIEVLELSLGRSIVAEHLACFGIASAAAEPPGSSTANSVVAKMILTARRAGTLTEPIPAVTPPDILPPWPETSPLGPTQPRDRASLWDVPDVADIPRVGTRFEVGDPVLTVFGRGRTLGGSNSDLLRRMSAWRKWLRGEGTWPGAIRPEC